MKKSLLAFTYVLWLTIILALFFVVQKPDFLSVLAGIKNVFLVVSIPFLMAILAVCMGAWFIPDSDPIEKIIFGFAIGMGIFGLAGFGLAILGCANPWALLIILLALTAYYMFTGKFIGIWKDINHLAREVYESIGNAATWIPISTSVAIGLAFIMALAPPIEDFDALSYHLVIPELWLRDGSLLPHQALTYWFPHIVEGSFVIPMVFGVDTATHLIHLLWLVVTMLIVWHWARQIGNNAIAWDAIAILLTMPSLLWLASWAYTDYTLSFAGIGTIYSIWKWRSAKDKQWITVSAIMAGIAMGTKYSSFVIPLTAILLIVAWEQENLKRIKGIINFSLISGLVASPWYIRNWYWTQNPIFPSVFGGRFWDSFLAQRFPASSAGIGFDIVSLIQLPLTATLGLQDRNFFDGRFGPFFLILLPITVWACWQSYREKSDQRFALLAICLLSLAGIMLWTLGVVQSYRLFQSRYLFPALIPLSIPLAIGLNSLYSLDSPKFRVSFIMRSMLAFAVTVNLLNFSLQTLARNPLSVAVGIISRQEYIERQQPGYSHALALIKNLSTGAKVYLLFEPRSYGMNLQVEPDILNTNFSHDLWLYKTPEKIISAWQKQRYTHILLSNAGADFVFHSKDFSSLGEGEILEQVKALLIPLGTSNNGDYTLYKVP